MRGQVPCLRSCREPEDGATSLRLRRRDACSTMKHMDEVGIRELKQNASAVVARVAAGETVTVTDRRRPVAKLVPLGGGRLSQLVASGQARPAKRPLGELGMPTAGGDLTST